MENKNKIAIYLSDEDSYKFKLFLENYETFSLLLEHAVFDQRNANVTLNFDSAGVLSLITRNDLLYKVRPIQPIPQKDKVK